MTYSRTCGDNLFSLLRLVKTLHISLTCPDIPNCLFLHQKRRTNGETCVFAVRTLFQIVSLGFWTDWSQVSLDGKHSWWKSTPKPAPREVISPPTQDLNSTTTRAGGRRPRPTFWKLLPTMPLEHFNSGISKCEGGWHFRCGFIASPFRCYADGDSS